MNNIDSQDVNSNYSTVVDNKRDEIIVAVSNLHKIYSRDKIPLHVLKGIDVEIKRGSIVSVTGESGSGKSTFLNLVGGLDIPTRGAIIVNGINIVGLDDLTLSKFRNTQLGFIFQFHYLLPDFSALENVMLPYLKFRYDKKEGEKRAKKLLSDVGLEERIHHKPSELSGGEQQRVAIARALVNNPEIVLADEPTGNLDEDNSEMVRRILWELRDKYNLTVILVTHNLPLASQADKVMKLSHGVFINKTEDLKTD
jgi:lipoprotein-releasing system ATP-binding protein